MRGELTSLQLEVLQILWEEGEAPVSRVHERLLGRGRKLAYTTVMTLCKRLAERKVLKYRQEGRAYIYSPAVARESVLKGILGGIAERAFGGSETDLAMTILSDCEISAEELAELRKLVALKEGELKLKHRRRKS